MTIMNASYIKDGMKYVIKRKAHTGKVLAPEWQEVNVMDKSTNLIKIQYFDDEGLEYYRWIDPKDYDWEYLDKPVYR